MNYFNNMTKKIGCLAFSILFILVGCGGESYEERSKRKLCEGFDNLDVSQVEKCIKNEQYAESLKEERHLKELDQEKNRYNQFVTIYENNDRIKQNMLNIYQDTDIEELNIDMFDILGEDEIIQHPMYKKKVSITGRIYHSHGYSDEDGTHYEESTELQKDNNKLLFNTIKLNIGRLSVEGQKTIKTECDHFNRCRVIVYGEIDESINDYNQYIRTLSLYVDYMDFIKLD